MKSRRFWVIIIICAAASLLSLFLFIRKVDFFNTIDLKLKDVRFRTRGDMISDKRVVVVAIDSKSVNELGRWPWDRKVIARLIENLKAYGAKTVALDIVFSEPSNASSDGVLADAMQKSGNVIAGYFFRYEDEGKTEASREYLQASKVDNLRIGGGAQDVPIMAFPNVETNIPAITRAAGSAGFFNIIPDKDGLLRTANLVAVYNGDAYPSLPLSALRHYLDNQITLDVAPYGVDGIVIGNRRIPADEAGRFSLNYYGRQGAFRTISVSDVINKKLESGALNDAIVFVGATEIGISDLRPTPFDPVLPGVEVHATVTSNVLQERFLIRDGRVITLEILLIVILPLILAIFLIFTRKTLTALLMFSGITALYIIANYFMFAWYFLNTSIIFPIISIGLTYLGSEIYRNFIEERQGRFLKKAFTSYVSPDLVGEILKNPKMLKLGGEKREVTVLFSDIREFTAISERLEPDLLIQLLNKYFGPMTNVILEHNGTLDKYIGDAIMAIFNAPLDIENHSVLACQSAMDMLDKLNEINADFKEAGLPEIDIGIGINTGDAIAGNVGTEVRFDYTAIGDTVNLASRLEGMNKIYHTNTIVSETVRRHFEQSDDQSYEHGNLTFRELDLIRVKGKNEPVTVYELSLNMNRKLIDKFEEGLKLYRQRQFKDAQEIFEGLKAEHGDRPSEVFAQRCREFIDSPPGADWDGVYTAKTK